MAELKREVLELDQLVDRLLAHSRLEFDRIDTRVLDHVRACVESLERTATDASVLEVESMVTQLVADPTLLARPLANVLHKARQHAGGVDRLRIFDEAHAGPSPSAPAHGLAFIVDDRGPGIDPAMNQRIFAHFVQGETRGPRRGSFGLGLSLVQRIAAAHGGHAWARNRAGGGASIGFSIPFEP